MSGSPQRGVGGVQVLRRRSLAAAIALAAFGAVITTWLGTALFGALVAPGTFGGVLNMFPFYFLFGLPIALFVLYLCAPLYAHLRAAGRAPRSAVVGFGAAVGCATAVIAGWVFGGFAPAWLAGVASVGAAAGAVAGLTLYSVHIPAVRPTE